MVVAYVAEQLGLEPPAFTGYGSSEARWAHQEQIRDGYGYTKFEFDQWFALARWLYQRAWIGNKRPTLLFDLATKRHERHGGQHGRSALVTYLRDDVAPLCRARFRTGEVRRQVLSAASRGVHL